MARLFRLFGCCCMLCSEIHVQKQFSFIITSWFIQANTKRLRNLYSCSTLAVVSLFPALSISLLSWNSKSKLYIEWNRNFRNDICSTQVDKKNHTFCCCFVLWCMNVTVWMCCRWLYVCMCVFVCACVSVSVELTGKMELTHGPLVVTIAFSVNGTTSSSL